MCLVITDSTDAMLERKHRFLTGGVKSLSEESLRASHLRYRPRPSSLYAGSLSSTDDPILDLEVRKVEGVKRTRSTEELSNRCHIM